MPNLTFRQITQFVWSYLKVKPGWLIFLLLLIIIRASVEVAMPFLLGKFIDFVTLNFENAAANLTGALFWLGLITATGLSFWTLQTTSHWLFDYFKLPLLKKVICDTFARVQTFASDWHTNSFAGATTRKISRGLWSFDEFINIFYFNFLPLTFLFCGMTSLLFWRWPLMGVLVFCGGMFYFITSVIAVQKLTAQQWQALARADTKITAILADAITCNASVKIFGRENFELKKLQQVSEIWRQKFWRAVSNHHTVALLQAFVMTALKFGMFLLVIYFWLSDQASVGDFVFVFGSYNLISSYLRSIGENIRNIQRNARDLEDIVLFAQQEPEVRDKPQAQKLVVQKGTLELQKVTFKYRNQLQTVFQNFSLKIKAGERVAIVGHSGGGKTTFVKLIQRLYDVQTGTILIDGQNIAQVTQKSLRRGIGLVPQEPLLFHRSLAENIAYGQPQASLAAIQRAAHAAHAAEFIERLPQKYQTLVGERGVKLSGGERQRIAIARVILANSPILILDEATSSLDSESEKLIQGALTEVMKNRTTIVIAHRLATIKKVDRILVFEHGKIIESGAHTQLVKKPRGTYRKLFELQAGGFI